MGNRGQIQYQPLNSSWLMGIWLFIAAFISALVAVLSQEFILLVLVLLVGLPFIILVVKPQTRSTAVVLILVFVPLTSILKAITGSRFAPLTFDLALMLAFGLCVGEGLARHKIRLGWLDFCFGLFLFWACLQMFNPNVPSLQAGVEGLRKFAFASILFYIGRHFFRVKDIILFQKAVFVISIFIALYGLKQFFFMSAVDHRMIEMASASPITYLMGGWVRPFSTLPGPFHLGLYLMTVSLLLLAQVATRYGRFSIRLFIPFLFLLHFIVLLFTRTKGNWAGLIVGIVVLFSLQTQQPIKLIMRLAILAFAGVIVVMGILSLAPRNSVNVLEDAVVAISNPWEAPTFLYRVQLWEEIMVPALRENPLFGYGTSSAGEGLSNLYKQTNSKHFASHNLYLKVFLEQGLIGLFLFFILIIGSLWRGWKAIRQRQSSVPIVRLTQFWGIATVVAFLMAGLVIPTLDAYPANYYFWLLLGLISSHEFTPKLPVHQSVDRRVKPKVLTNTSSAKEL